MTSEQPSAPSSNQWPQRYGDDAMNLNSHDDEFASFLDLDTDFSNLEGLDHANSGLDTPMGRLGFGQYPVASHDGGNMELDMSRSVPMTEAMMFQVSAPGSAVHHQAYHIPQHHQHMLPHGYQVPLTPLSSDIHAAKYAQQVEANQKAMYEHGQLSFTPLVSPAQTPLDSNFRMPEYAGNNEFFSPLSSPAIDAQHVLGSNIEPMSPADGLSEPSKRSQTASKRGRRKGSVSTRASARSIKQSPATKPQSRRRAPSLTAIPPDLLEAMNSGAAANNGAKPGSAPSQTSDSSVSPEPLTDVLMPPPAMPRTSKSPNASKTSLSMTSEPATPSTLMRLPTAQGKRPLPTGSGDSILDEDDAMHDLALPESAVGQPLAVDTAAGGSAEGDITPTLSAKSAKLNATDTPKSAAATPRVFSPDDTGSLRRPESRVGPRGSKKRQGTASATISPALRPKISPSISPLVPTPGIGMPAISAETSALYLASKSNYQNILEGTHLPGVSYPEALAENLSSKRTSHKIAEQGRRNRINTALKEIESLLPQNILTASKKERTNSDDHESPEKTPSSAQSTSKASTVEMAAIYIKDLESQLKEAKDKLAAVEQKLKEGSSSGSQTSE